MGVAGLWAFLREEGHVHPLEGVELAKHVEGKVLAIDASLWLMQSQLEDSHTHDRKHIKVVFERVIHFLMMGALPVLVFEGSPPPAKQEQPGTTEGPPPSRVLNQSNKPTEHK